MTWSGSCLHLCLHQLVLWLAHKTPLLNNLLFSLHARLFHPFSYAVPSAWSPPWPQQSVFGTYPPGSYITDALPSRAATNLYHNSLPICFMHLHVLSHFSRVWLCNPKECSLPDSSVHGILQTRIMQWLDMLSSRGSSLLRDGTHISCLSRQILYCWATREVPICSVSVIELGFLWQKLCCLSQQPQSLR